MAFGFGFGSSREHRVFNYRPRYYDVEKEELREKFGHVDGSNEKEEYVPGSIIKNSLRNGNYSRTRGANKVQKIIGYVGLLLFFVVLIYLIKFFGMLA